MVGLSHPKLMAEIINLERYNIVGFKYPVFHLFKQIYAQIFKLQYFYYSISKVKSLYVCQFTFLFIIYCFFAFTDIKT